MEKVIKQLQCLGCGHRWYPKKPTPPKICPVCKRTNWQTGKPKRPLRAGPSIVLALAR